MIGTIDVKVTELEVVRRLLLAFADLAEAGRRLRATAPVDDDFPEMLHNFDGALRAALEFRADLPAPDPVDVFLEEVRAEIKRARAKFPGDELMTIAASEEFGELTKAVLDEPAANVRKEAVQAATMAARVALDGDGSVREWRARRGLDPLGVSQEIAR